MCIPPLASLPVSFVSTKQSMLVSKSQKTRSDHIRLVQEIRRFAVGANLVFALLLRPLPWGDHKDRPYTKVPMSFGRGLENEAHLA